LHCDQIDKEQRIIDAGDAGVLIYRYVNGRITNRWLTCSGWFTHISGDPSAAGRAQDRESSLAKDRRFLTVPRNQPTLKLWVTVPCA